MTERLSMLQSHLRNTDSVYLRSALAQQIHVETLRIRISECTSCELASGRLNAVPLDGPTHGRAELVLVGEAPGFAEDKSGRPFVGRSGMLLDRMLEKAGTSRSKVVIMNTLCCRPPANADPTPQQLHACEPNFFDQLDITKTWVGVALGGYALANIMGVDRSSIRIRDYLDKPIWVDGRVWWGTYHPAYAARNPEAKPEIILSIRAALAVRHGENPIPMSDAENQPTRDAEDLITLKGLDILGLGDKIADTIQKKGWIFAKSDLLDEVILVVKEEKDAYNAKIPRTLKERSAIYTVDELVRVGEAGAARGGWKKADLRRLHMVKKEFRGEVVA